MLAQRDDDRATRTWIGRVFIATSMDGFIARADGDIGWLTDPPPDRSHAEVASDRPAARVGAPVVRVAVHDVKLELTASHVSDGMVYACYRIAGGAPGVR